MLRLALLLLFIPMGISAQITVVENDFPEADDTIRVGTDNIHNFNGNLTGTDYTWNFSNLQSNNQRVDTFVSVFSTIAAYNVVFNPLIANLATPNNAPPSFPSLTITESYDFYKLSSSYYRKAGFGAKINNVPTPVKYDDPEIILSLPAVYGNVDSSESFYGIPVPGIGYFGQTIKRKNSVDGWGTLIIPYGTFSVLRIKSEIQTTDTIYSNALGFGYTTQRPLSVEYSWMGNAMDVPLLKVIPGSGPSSSATFRDSLYYTGLNIIQNDFFNVFPNPATENINIITSGNRPANRIYRIIDRNGLTVLSWFSSDAECKADISELANGFYILEISTDGRTTGIPFIKL